VLHAGNFSYSYIFTYSTTEIWLVLGLSLLSSLIHEFGHASACQRFAGRTGEIGVGINMLVPVFFANVSNIYTLKRHQKALVAVAGLYFQMLFGAVVMLFADSYEQLDKFITLYLIGFVFSLLPLYRNDGYWFLSDLCNRKDLLADSFTVLRGKKAATVLDLAYGLFFLCTMLLIAALVLRFLLYSGPALWREVVASPVIDFPLVIKASLVFFHYLAIFFFFYALAKATLVRVFKTLRSTGANTGHAS
jgi:hypothetical protein